MERMKTGGHMIVIDGVEVEYGRIPSAISPHWAELIYYFETRDTPNHDELVKKAVDRLCDENSRHGVSWRADDAEKVEYTKYYQLTIVGINIYDIY